MTSNKRYDAKLGKDDIIIWKGNVLGLAFLDAGDDGGKVVVEQDHVGRLQKQKCSIRTKINKTKLLLHLLVDELKVAKLTPNYRVEQMTVDESTKCHRMQGKD